MGAVTALRQGSRASYWLLLVGMCAGGAAVGWLIGWLLWRSGIWPGLGFDTTSLVGLWIAALAYLFICRRWATRRFRQKMRERGLATRFQYGLEISDGGLALRSGRVESLAAWPAVTEVFRAKSYWIFMVQTAPWFLPSRFFTDQAEEKAFLKTALEHMTPEARARSRAAEAFARN